MMYMAACSGWRRPSKKPWLCQLACMMCPTTCSRAAISQVMQELRKATSILDAKRPSFPQLTIQIGTKPLQIETNAALHGTGNFVIVAC